jgi:transmembrane sensor
MTDDNESGLPEFRDDQLLPWELLTRYIAGECSAREAQDVERWAAADPGRAELLDDLRATWNAAGASAPAYDVEGILRRSKRRRGGVPLQLTTDVPTPAARRPVRITPTGIAMIAERRWWRGAVAAAVLVGLGMWAWDKLPSGATAVPERELSTGVGQRLVVRLGDGTRVTLAPGSHLRYADPDVVGRPPRMVTLEGAAVFDVVHDESHPFTVRAGDLVTRDVGTRFAIRAYASDANPEVVVADGAVTVQVRSPAPGHATQAPVTLHAAERARADSAGELVHDVGVDTAVAMAWTSGRLVFRAVPMREVVAELHRWYGIDVRLGDSALAGRRLTASFTREPVMSVLASVAAAVSARTERVGSAVYFRVEQ